MPDQPPAETLTAAARLLREHLGYLALHDVRGPWGVHAGPTGYPQEINNVGVPLLVANTFTDPKAPPVMANYIALMHPGVGLALADWLEATAAYCRASITHPTHVTRAYAVARLLLGDPT